MGGCCSRNDTDNDTIEMSSSMNVAVTCKSGLYGNNVKVSTDPSTNFYSVSGQGTALGSCVLDCDTAYWEIRIGNKPECVCVGIKRFNTKKPVSLDESLAVDSTTAWLFNNEGTELKKGDVIGVYWDQTDLPMLSFSLNGELLLDSSINRIRPAIDIIPAVSVESGSTCEMIFDGNHFLYPPTSNGKFKMIICASNLI
jgi:hypothetical protein